MKGAGSAVMDDERAHRDALAAAGYTGRRGAVVFACLVGAVGALVGSVLFAILWNVLVPGRQEVATLFGVLAGGLIGVLLALSKVRRGNREAAEEVDDKEWRRHMMRNIRR
jgi:hypothetical protein